MQKFLFSQPHLWSRICFFSFSYCYSYSEFLSLSSHFMIFNFFTQVAKVSKILISSPNSRNQNSMILLLFFLSIVYRFLLQIVFWIVWTLVFQWPLAEWNPESTACSEVAKIIKPLRFLWYNFYLKSRISYGLSETGKF